MELKLCVDEIAREICFSYFVNEFHAQMKSRFNFSLMTSPAIVIFALVPLDPGVYGSAFRCRIQIQRRQIKRGSASLTKIILKSLATGFYFYFLASQSPRINPFSLPSQFFFYSAGYFTFLAFPIFNLLT